MLIKKNFFYSIVLVHASSVRTRDWTRTCSWTLNRTRTEPIDKVRVRFEFKYYRFGFGSSSSIMGSGSVRVRKTARWAGSSSGSSSRFNELEPDRTEPRNTNSCYINVGYTYIMCGLRGVYNTYTHFLDVVNKNV